MVQSKKPDLCDFEKDRSVENIRFSTYSRLIGLNMTSDRLLSNNSFPLDVDEVGSFVSQLHELPFPYSASALS